MVSSFFCLVVLKTNAFKSWSLAEASSFYFLQPQIISIKNRADEICYRLRMPDYNRFTRATARNSLQTY
jgi:hypothetical protein